MRKAWDRYAYFSSRLEIDDQRAADVEAIERCYQAEYADSIAVVASGPHRHVRDGHAGAT